jgi:Fe-S oxidoreductase
VIFHEAKADWTLSISEASNYGVFLADPKRAKAVAARIVEEARQLGVEEIIVSECGHAYASYRWDVPNWFGPDFPLRVRSILEVLDEYLRAGRISVDPAAISEPVTYHDSCNLGRNGGLLEEPRRVLASIASDFREMIPNREESICCGGGGGLVALEEYTERRISAGKPKAEQIRKSGARIVVAACENYRLQLGDLNQAYGLDIQVSSMADLVVRAMDIAKR